MSDHKDQNKDQKSNTEELIQVKSTLGEADKQQFSLDEILAEYGSKKPQGTRPVPVIPRARDTEPDPNRPRSASSNVVAFPSRQPLCQSDSQPESNADSEVQEDGDGDHEEPEEGETPEEPDPDKVLSFPDEESALSAFLKNLGRRADDYADQMFHEDENTDQEEVRRLEQLIPGTDQEEPQPPHREPRFHRRPRPQTPPPPDYSPRELLQRYNKSLRGLHSRTVLVFLLALLALFQLLVPMLKFQLAPPLDQPVLQVWIVVGLLGLGILLSADALLHGLAKVFHLKIDMDTLALLSCLFTLADGVMLALSENPQRLPYGVVALTGLFFLLHGTYHYKCAIRLACRTAAATSSPYRITLDEGKWNGLDTYAKWSGDTEHFGSQIQIADGAQRIFHRFCPVILLADLLVALMNSVYAQRAEQFIWCLSALFSATAAFGGALVYSRPFHKVTRRLAKNGAVLAGWPGVASSRSGNRVLITDTDLFPPGTVTLNGYKILSGFSSERVLSYTATLIRASGSGLAQPFHDELRRVGGLLKQAERLCCYEGGGLSANVRGDEVLVGSADFMDLMEIPLPLGLSVKNAAFCAINGKLAGIFALYYDLPATVFPAMEEFLESRVGPVLATRDFNLIPSTLSQRFKLATNKMDFPRIERRRELSDPEQSHSDTLVALLTREGLLPFAETITAAKRLRMATRLGAALCCLASLFGLLLAGYLTSVSAFTSLSPINLLLFMLLWLSPTWFLSGWVHRY